MSVGLAVAIVVVVQIGVGLFLAHEARTAYEKISGRKWSG
jgi:hypothetical protein